MKKMPVTLYASDARFAVHGIAISHPDGRREFRTDVEAAILESQAQYGQELEKVAVIFHNACFDYLVLHGKYGLRIRYIGDTMLLSRLLHGASEEHDLRALADRLGLPAKGRLDFMSGVRHPDADQLRRLTEYAITDVALTSAAADLLIPQAAVHVHELWAMEHSVRMFVERPLTIDRDQAARAHAALEADISNKVAAGGLDEAGLRSPIKFGARLTEALASTGRKPPYKQGKKGPILAVAKNDAGRDQLLHDADPAVRALMAAKTAVGSAADARSRIRYIEGAAMGNLQHFLISYNKAVTGRYAGGGGFNIQNLKKIEDAADEDSVAACLRNAICAPIGSVFVSGDASQIEARVLARLAGQDDLHAAFAAGRDVYSEFASARMGREVRKPKPSDPPEVASEMSRLRQIGKTAILGLGYGMGVDKFLDRLQACTDLAELFKTGVLSRDIVAGLVYAYRDRYSRIPLFWRECEDAVRKAVAGVPSTLRGIGFEVTGGTLFIRLPSGRALVYPRIREAPPTYGQKAYTDRHGASMAYVDDKAGVVYANGANLYGGLIVENITQAVARDLLIGVMFKLEQSGLPVVLHCHDSVTVAVPPDAADVAAASILKAWRDIPGWIPGLILDAETKTGSTLAAA